MPLGIVKLGPDLYTGSDAYSGYLPDGTFIGFSLIHERQVLMRLAYMASKLTYNGKVARVVRPSTVSCRRCQ